ncbi:MAG: hypothetical protein ACTTKH_06900 [Treponema sp.]
MRLSKLLKMTTFVAFATLFLFSCNQANNGKKGGKTTKTLTVKTLKVKTSANPGWADATKSGDNFNVTLPTAMDKIESATDIQAVFELGGKEKTLAFDVEGTFPIALAEPGTPTEIKITVPKSATGEYEALSFKLIATRKVPTTTLIRIKLKGKSFEEKNIEDFTNIPEITTAAQDTDVYFYTTKGTAAGPSDAELLKRITTEPKLEDVSIRKVWKLGKATNTLAVKLDGKPFCTITVKRNPLEVGEVTVKGNDFLIVSNPENDTKYETNASKIAVSVTPKDGFQYTTVTVKVGDASEVNLVKGHFDIFSGEADIKDGENEVTITVKDDSTDAEALKYSRKFIIKKEGNNLDGNIDDSVKIEELWVGTEDMEKENVNKFKAEKGSDDHKYTVHVNKDWDTTNVSLIVKGTATTAIIKDATKKDSTTKADGTEVFKSDSTFSTVRKNENKYVFILENNGKRAGYEVTVVFDKVIEVQYTINITQPENGKINVYKMIGAQRIDITVDTSGILKVKKDSTNNKKLYFELLGTNGKKPKKLTADGVTRELGNIKSERELGKKKDGTLSIVISRWVNDFSVSGECE